MNDVIRTNGLTKKYGSKLAVNQVSIHVKQGDIYGLIGKNGAGKTTLMKLLVGLARANAGTMQLMGGSDLNAARKRIGALIEAPALYRGETAYENLKQFGLLTQTTDAEIKELLELVGLSDTGKKKVGAFSLGMKQRLGIAIALLGKPEVLILDEPINGLDPAGIKEIRDIIHRLNQQGVTFLISSHLLDELGKIATTYGIMNDGVLVEEISAAELEHKCRKSLKITTDHGERAANLLFRWNPALRMTYDRQNVTVYSEVEDASELNRVLVEAGARVYELKDDSMGFEDYFIERLG